jgi:hypothetical protein
MSLAQTLRHTLSRRWVWLATRGVAVGFALAAVFPTEEVRADCDCHDWGEGNYSCTTSQTDCVAGTEVCNVDCR